MHKNFAHIVLLVSAVLLTPAAMAQSAPAEITQYVHASKPYGKARVTFAFFTVYDAALWTDAQPFSMDKPFVLTLTYRHSFSNASLVKKTVDEMARIDNIPEAKLKEYGSQLTRIWPDVKPDDVITAVNLPGKKTVFYYNGHLSGEITDPAFNKPFFDVWLSEKTSEPAARKALLTE